MVTPVGLIGKPRLAIAVYGGDADDAEREWPSFSTLRQAGFRIFVVDSLGVSNDPRTLSFYREEASEELNIAPGGGAIEVIANRLEQDEWITFINILDPSTPSYFEALNEKVLDAHIETDLLISNHERPADPDGHVPKHPLSVHHQMEASVDLDQEPSYFPYLFESAVFRASHIKKSSVKFHEKFSADAGTIYLWEHTLELTKPRILFLSDPTYKLGPRPDPSALDRVLFENPEKFTTVLEQGVLNLLHRELRKRHAIPAWFQAAIIYTLAGYMQADDMIGGRMNAEMHNLADPYHSTFGKIRRLIDDSVVDSTPGTRLPPQRYLALKYGYNDQPWVDDTVVVQEKDKLTKSVRVSYFFKGPAPEHKFYSDGREAKPITQKTRAVVYAGKTLLYEQVVWLRAPGLLRAEINAQDAQLVGRRHSRNQRVYRTFAPSADNRDVAITVRDVIRRLMDPRWWSGRVLRTLARSRLVQRWGSGAWILMDRVERANDNAEHLFSYLHLNRPDINVWFALHRGSADWKRLKRAGYRNLLAYGSIKWKLVCANATHIISSQAGPYVYNPQPLHRVGVPPWKFVFLQHGVIHTNLARWLNLRRFAKFMTTTLDEYAAIAGNGSTYRFTPREVQLTGQPRHDRLNRLNRQQSELPRKWILVAPTWRDSLLGGKISQRGNRRLLDEFSETDYAKRWRSLLTNPELKSVADGRNLKVAFLPHPNVEPYIDQFELPSWVEVLTYETIDVQQTLVDTELMITDYSSVVFDAALIRRSILYYQFDLHEVFSGNLTGRQGYFSFRENGFGPVVEDESELLEYLSQFATFGQFASKYFERVAETFPFPDDEENCQRVVAAIEEERYFPPADPEVSVVVAPEAPRDLPTPQTDSPLVR